MRKSMNLAIEKIKANPYQPRLDFDNDQLMELALSIKENGLIHPITVRDIDGHYEIVAGERRFRAMKMLGYTEVPAIVLTANEYQMAEMALVENIQRENLSSIEEAKAYVKILEESNLTQAQLAKKMGKSQSAIANKIRLLNLDSTVQDAVTTKKISERHARALLTLDKEKQVEMLHKIIDKKMTVADVEKLCNKTIKPKQEKKMFKGFSKNIRIGVNTIKQSYSMIIKTGIEAKYEEIESDDEYKVVVTFKK